MAITNASRLADFGSGIGTEGAVLQVDNTNNRLGVGTTNPQGMLQVGTGITMYSTGIGSFNSDVYVGGDATVLGNLNVTGDISYDEVSGRNLVITQQSTTKDLNVTGVATAASFSGNITATTLTAIGIATVGILTSYESITIKVGAGSTEVATELSSLSTSVDSKASTGKAIAMAMVFG
jgi:hypothetical protein